MPSAMNLRGRLEGRWGLILILLLVLPFVCILFAYALNR
jgi:hypothetical protein